MKNNGIKIIRNVVKKNTTRVERYELAYQNATRMERYELITRVSAVTLRAWKNMNGLI
jgi:hypothetical protein